jgi:hypothetical protein
MKTNELKTGIEPTSTCLIEWTMSKDVFHFVAHLIVDNFFEAHLFVI